MNIKSNKAVSKNNAMLGDVRRLTIKRLLREEGSAKVAELSRVLNVSEVTIRRDLDVLEQENQIRRVHGGAVVLGDQIGISELFDRRSQEHKEEKRRIGQAAAHLIKNGNVVILGAGTTTTGVARSLAAQKKNLTVITNSVSIATELSMNPGISVMLTGGSFRRTSLSLAGPKAAESLRDLNADMYFLAVQGISVERGLTSASFSDLSFKRTAMKTAKEVIVVADSSKLGNVEFCTIAPISAVHRIITDSKIPKEMVEKLNSHQVRLTVV